MTQRFAIVATALSTDPRQAAQRARALGFHGLQIDAVGPSLDVTQLSQTGRRELRHVLSSNDQQLVGLRAAVGPKGFGVGADIDRILARMQQIMESAKGLGSPLVCVDAGPLPEPARSPQPSAPIAPEQAGLIIIPTPSRAQAEPARPGPDTAPDPALVSHVDSVLAALGAVADRIGCSVAFRSDLASFAALERALASAACPSFGVDLDPVAILRDDWPIDEVFSRLGALVRHVRARDALVGADRRTQQAPIGRGSTNWEEFLAALDSAGYSGWITIDPLELPDRPAAAGAALNFLSARTSPP